MAGCSFEAKVVAEYAPIPKGTCILQYKVKRIKHSRYTCFKMYNFTSIHSHAKTLYLHMFDTVDTAFSYERELIVSFLQDLSKGKGIGLQFICYAHTAFLLCRAT